MTIVSSHVEAAMGVLAEHAKELGFGRVTLWCHITTDVEWNDWTIFASEDESSTVSNMFEGSTFEEAFAKAKAFINNRKNAEILLSL